MPCANPKRTPNHPWIEKMKSPEECTTIEDVRAGIDTLDREIISLLGKRFGYVKAVTRFKKTADDVRAEERRAAVLRQRRVWAEEEGLHPDVIEKMYVDLIDYFIAAELDVMGLTGNGKA
jgi:isochorismate pyruvate lyase